MPGSVILLRERRPSEESDWMPYSPDEVSPSRLTWMQGDQAGDESPAAQIECPTRNILPQIDSCAKAKVVAVMAMDLLAFDGTLYGGRSNWACPFAKCREKFLQAKELMRHVLTCAHFSSDNVYCNSCDEHDCFALQACHGQPCCCCDDGAAGGERVSRKKSKMRKLTNLFTRSRAGSRSSTPTLGHADSPNSAFGRQSILSAMIPSPSPSNKGRKQSIACSPELPSQAIDSSFQAVPRQEMDASSHPCELPGGMETMAQELPAPVQNWDTEMIVSPVSPVSPVSMESPVEDVSMDQRMPDWSVVPGDGNATSHAVASFQLPFSSVTAFQPTQPPPVRRKRQPSWASASHRSSMFGNDAVSVISCLPGVPWPSTTTTPSPSRQGSGDSSSSTVSQSTVISQYSGSSLWFPQSQETNFGSTAADASAPSPPWIDTSSQNSVSPAAEMEDYSCPYCNYYPTGKIAYYGTYLNRHMANKHSPSRFPCPGCPKEFSRMDNLKTHQKNSCPKTRPEYNVERRCRW